MMHKRLFLVAGYSPKNIADDSLVYMAQKLSECGDVILVMDNDLPDSELDKLRPYTIYCAATRHGEYDFGSYKRAYVYAADNELTKKYEFVYMVNDSVYGPLYPLEPVLTEIESRGFDAFGLAYNNHPKKPHLQSWIIGMRPSVFLSPWYDKFMRSITKQAGKGAVISLYEHGFTRMMDAHSMKYGAIYITNGRKIYNHVRKLAQQNMPFIKKCSFTRHNGCLARQLIYALNRGDKNARDAIISGARQTLGNEYMDWLLTKNPLKIFWRGLTYTMRKIFIEGI